MKAKLVKVAWAVLLAFLLLLGCAGVQRGTESDDGFYQWGKGKGDWTTRY